MGRLIVIVIVLIAIALLVNKYVLQDDQKPQAQPGEQSEVAEPAKPESEVPKADRRSKQATSEIAF